MFPHLLSPLRRRVALHPECKGNAEKAERPTDRVSSQDFSPTSILQGSGAMVLDRLLPLRLCHSSPEREGGRSSSRTPNARKIEVEVWEAVKTFLP